MKRNQFIALTLFTLLFTVGCGTNIPRLIPTPTPTSLIAQVRIQQSKWYRLRPKSYHIVIKFYEALAVGIETQVDVTVRDYSVVYSSCVSNECPAVFFTDTYTVDDLFLVALGSTLTGKTYAPLGSYDDCVKGIDFDETYGFPRSMSIDCPDVADEEHSFQVISFEVLK